MRTAIHALSGRESARVEPNRCESPSGRRTAGANRSLAVAVAVAVALTAASWAHADYILSTPEGAEINGLPVNARATFTMAPDQITLLLENLQVNPTSVAQNLSSLLFTVSTGQDSGILSDSSAVPRWVAVDDTYTDGPAGRAETGTGYFFGCFLGRPGGAEGVRQAQGCGHPPDPVVLAQRRPTVHAPTHRRQLRFGQRLVHEFQPVRRPARRRDPQRTLRRRPGPPPQRRPPPVLRTTHQPGTQRVPLHVSQQKPQRVRPLQHARGLPAHRRPPPLHRERLEPPLPDVPAAAVATMIPPNVRGHQPLHPRRQVPVGPRPDHEVEVVGHEVKAKRRSAAAGTTRARAWPPAGTPAPSAPGTRRSRRRRERPRPAHSHGSTRGSTAHPSPLGLSLA